MQKNSREIAKAAMMMAMSDSRDQEEMLKKQLAGQNIRAGAVDCGGEFIPSVPKIIERAIVAAKREGVISETHVEEGAIAGAAHDALGQLMPKAMGLNIGGKIGIARFGDHICVAMFFAIGMGHLNEVGIGMSHRAVPSLDSISKRKVTEGDD